MQTHLPLLNNLQVAKPCAARWERMRGDERKRYCQECGLHVYNVSSMTRSEAEAFLRRSSGRTCVRFYRRRDGTILTQDCPVGLAKVRKKLVFWLNFVTASVLGIGQAWPFSQEMGDMAAPQLEATTGKLISTLPSKESRPIPPQWAIADENKDTSAR